MKTARLNLLSKKNKFLGPFIFFSIFIRFFLISSQEIDYLVAKIVSIHPHDSTVFTQGLAIKANSLYESGGLYGLSTLRKIDLNTNQTVNQIRLPSSYFGEGIAIHGDFLIQTTWKENKAFVYNRHTLQLVKTFPYAGEGWGLCGDGEKLFMSNGTSLIAVRDPHTFKLIDSYQARAGKRILTRLNDLECVGESLYVNIWGENTIARLE